MPYYFTFLPAKTLFFLVFSQKMREMERVTFGPHFQATLLSVKVDLALSMYVY